MTDSISSITGATAPQSASQQSAASLADDFSTFLTLLTTQLQNQDPLDPLDSNEFTNQLVAFTGVEQQIRTNSNLEDIITQLGNDNITGVASLLGQEALIEGFSGTHEGSGIHFEVGFVDAPDFVDFEIMDGDGNTVFQAPGQAISGLQDFTWDGTNAAGDTLPDGVYSLRVTASKDGEAVRASTFVQDEISAINTASDDPVLTVGANDVTQDALLRLIAGGARL